MKSRDFRVSYGKPLKTIGILLDSIDQSITSGRYNGNNMFFAHFVSCKRQTADCRLRTRGKMQTERKMQTAN